MEVSTQTDITAMRDNLRSANQISRNLISNA